MDEVRTLPALLLAGAAALATVMAVAWRAAEETRGLDLADLRSVAIVGLAVFAVAMWSARRASA